MPRPEFWPRRDRQGLYVAMSRGREANYAYCVTGFPRTADVREGSRPAPELARVRRLMREHAALPPAAVTGAEDDRAPDRDPESVLAGVLDRDGAVLSATETLRNELSNADHLGVLGSIWYDLARRAQAARYARALREILPPVDAEAALGDPACTWLWRSLREAEAAGLDAGQVLRNAISARSLAGARDVARVIDSRVRTMIGTAVPQPPGSWADRVPDMADPELDRYMRELAAAMDDRVRRIGEHVVLTRPAWATQAFNDPPEDGPRRAEWQRRAARIGAYRELYGYNAPGDAIGPEPGKTSPEARADWHGAFTALGKSDGIDLRGCSDAQLRLRRGAYAQETGWAPPFVAEELRLARLQIRAAFENAIREEHEARATSDAAVAARHEQLARMWHAMHAKAVAGVLAEAQETRRQWEALTEPTRRIAVAADLELRRRHPDEQIDPLRSAEPQDAINDQKERPGTREIWVQPTLDGSVHLPGTGRRQAAASEQPPASPQRDALGQQALGLTPESVADPIPEKILRIADNMRTAQARIDDLRDTRAQ
jgi:hypothetical protein